MSAERGFDDGAARPRSDRPGGPAVRVSVSREGIPASPGIVIGPVRVLRMEIPAVPHGGSITADSVEAEVARFHEARAAVRDQIRRLQENTRSTMGEIEAQIFEPHLLMLDDPDLIEGTIRYIRENHLVSERAFEWRVLEWEAQWSNTGQTMVLDRINDLKDVQGRVLRRLMGLPEPDLASLIGGSEKVIVVARDLTPSVAAQLDPQRVLGLATDEGTRTSHSSILTRSLHIPCVVSVDNLSNDVHDGDELILDGRAGRVIINPTEADKASYRDRDFQIREWEQELLLLAHLEPTTQDGVRIDLRANIDLPGEAESARAHGAEGIGLFRTEFLVVGRSSIPPEEEQYRAFRQVLEAFPDEPVVIRTYDLGGDKFPAFLHMPREENPFLGWRAIRLCLDEPDLFRGQLRALIRAGAHGDVRIMLPMVTHLSEIEASRALIEETRARLAAEGYEVGRGCQIGAMIETPAAALIADALADLCDFFSIGTNDLVQYTLAVDRGSARLAHLYNPFHPAVVKLIHHVASVGEKKGIEVAVCGELAAHPLGTFMLIGMGIRSLSVGPAALAEIKKVIRSMYRSKARDAIADVLQASTPDQILRILWDQLRDDVDLDRFGGLINLWASG